MKRLQTKLTSLIILLLFLSNYAMAQVSCTEKLGKANAAFEKGQIDEVPEILGNCLSSGFTDDEKVSAYRLLTLCDLYYNRSEEASANMQNMLKINPEYKLQDIDPSEFQKLYGKFRTIPVFIIGIKGALCFNKFYDIQNYNDINSFNSNGKYTNHLGFNGGISLESPITKTFSVVAEAYYNSYSYTFERIILDYATQTIEEDIIGIDVPILGQYNILKEGNIIPYINGGVSVNYMIRSSLSLARKDTLENFSREPASKSFDMNSARNTLNFGVTGGLGVRIKNVVGKGYITFDARYTRYFLDITNNNERDFYPELTYGLLHTDNSFKLHNVQLYVGYKKPFYIPKLKRSVRKGYQEANTDE